MQAHTEVQIRLARPPRSDRSWMRTAVAWVHDDSLSTHGREIESCRNGNVQPDSGNGRGWKRGKRRERLHRPAPRRAQRACGQAEKNGADQPSQAGRPCFRFAIDFIIFLASSN